MEIPVCNRRCIDLQKKVRRPAGTALPFSTFRVAQRIGAISNKQIFFLLLCHSFYVPFQEDICYSEHMRGISCHLQGILPPLRSSEWHASSRGKPFVIPSKAGRPTRNLMLLSLGRDSSFHFVPFRMTLYREGCEKDIFTSLMLRSAWQLSHAREGVNPTRILIYTWKSVFYFADISPTQSDARFCKVCLPKSDIPSL